MVGHGRRLFQRAAVLEIGGDPRGPDAVIADRRLDPGRRRPAPDHRIGIGLLHRQGRTDPGEAVDHQPDLRVAIYPNDHRPAHVHVIGDGEAVFVLN